MKKNIAQLILMWTACALVSNAHADAAKREIENQKFEIFDTGLGARDCCGLSPAGIWLSNNLFAMTSSVDAPDAVEKHLLQVMLVDLKTKTSKVLVDAGQLVCWNAERRIASIQKTYTSTTGDIKYELIHLDAQGQVGTRSDKADINPSFCRSEENMPPKHTLPVLLRESDGYIQQNIPGTQYDSNRTAIWVPTGKTPVDLHVLVDEIDSRLGNYLAYSQKYLLNTIDSQRDSGTDRRLAGASWNRPYDLTPYRLMALDGSIEEIPYPKIIFEYGIKGFGFFLPTPNGILISTSNLLLLQGEQLTRVWPRPGLFGTIKREIVNGLALSPDGCKVAFRHFADQKYSTLKSVTILNLCQKA